MSATPSPKTPVPTVTTGSPGFRQLFSAPQRASIPSPVMSTTSLVVPMSLARLRLVAS